MSQLAIRVQNLSKEYRMGAHGPAYDTLREHLSLRAITGRRRGDRAERRRKFAALDGVSLDIEAGEIVGLIGRNGAGKTTLLRILTRITEPTAGRAEIRGRVGSLLEVGTGFHSELTGRENIYLNGAILGMRRREIEASFDKIVEFAGVSQFLDTPVKRYSTGMHVRLAFSVAAHLEPEILLVDEVLAVGDAEFQQRCLGKMQAVGESGRTVILVSHSMPTIMRLCQRAVLLETGNVVADGPSQTVISRYLQGAVGSPSRREWDTTDDAPGNEIIRLRHVAIVDDHGQPVETVDVRRPVGIEIAFHALTDGPSVRPQIMLTTEQGTHAFNAIDTNPRWREPIRKGQHLARAWIPGNLLNEGMVTVTVFVSTLTSGKTIQHVLERDVLSFQVYDPVEGDSAKGDYVGQWGGGVRPLLNWDRE